MLAGAFTLRQFTSRIHARYGHALPLAERLAELDDEYDSIDFGDRTMAEVDAEVMAEARKLAGRLSCPEA
ncbi:hypothetical protein ABT024_24760 [Streptomyces sp. NPDC002812]|uniref:hypothetical protein n=1 Tax=Streptomyces sp. NPDC002812 TaxID=3154434 RepID=UPI003321BB36